MKTTLRSLLIINILAFWIGVFIEIFESENFSQSYKSISEIFNNFIYNDSLIFIISIFLIVYVPYVLLFFLTKFSRQFFTLSMVILSLIVFLPNHDYPLIRFPYSNLFFEISLILDGIILGVIWFSPLKDSFSNSDFNPTKVINFFRNKRFYILSGILIFISYVLILNDELSSNWMYIGLFILMGIVMPWVLLLLLSIIICLSYVLLFPIRSFKILYNELYDSFSDYLPDILEENGKKSFNFALLISFPLCILFAYFYFFIALDIAQDTYKILWKAIFSKFISFGPPFGIAIIGLFLLILPVCICGIILMMIFGIVHTFRKINQPANIEKDPDLESARETFAKEFFNDDEENKKNK